MKITKIYLAYAWIYVFYGNTISLYICKEKANADTYLLNYKYPILNFVIIYEEPLVCIDKIVC